MAKKNHIESVEVILAEKRQMLANVSWESPEQRVKLIVEITDIVKRLSTKRERKRNKKMAGSRGLATSINRIYTDNISLKQMQRLPGSYGSAFK